MLVGDASRRRSDDLDPNSLEYRSTSFRCFDGEDYDPTPPAYGAADTFDLPKKTCSQGIRSNIYFPR